MRDVMAPEVPSYHLFTQPSDPTLVAERSRPWSGDSFSFHDVLDMLNPLQHLPVIGTIYRYLTGDSIGAVPRIIGDGLYGGPIGILAGLVDATLKQESGKDAGEQVVALVTGDEKVGEPTPPTVAAVPAPAAATAAATNTQSSAKSAASQPPTSGLSPVSGATVAPGAGPVNAAEHGAPVPAATIPGALPLTHVPAAAEASPRAALMARLETMRRQSAAGGLSNHVVPLEAVGLPLAANPPRFLPAAAAPAAPAVPYAALPAKPPVDISQQMMDALDKYARMQRQGATPAGERGSQIDFAQ